MFLVLFFSLLVICLILLNVFVYALKVRYSLIVLKVPLNPKESVVCAM